MTEQCMLSPGIGFVLTTVEAPAAASSTTTVPVVTWAASGGAGAPRGTLYAVYELLERLGGWRQLAWDSELFPPGAPHAAVMLPPAPYSVSMPGPPSGVGWREVDDWENFNWRNFSRRMRLNGANGAYDCVYKINGETDETCEGPGAWDMCPGGGCWANPPGGCHTIYVRATRGADTHCTPCYGGGAVLLPNVDGSVLSVGTAVREWYRQQSRRPVQHQLDTAARSVPQEP